MRTSELIAVRWSDMDWSKNTVRVERTLVEGKLVHGTKTPAGNRTIVLMPMAREALEVMLPTSKGKHSRRSSSTLSKDERFEGYEEIRKN